MDEDYQVEARATMHLEAILETMLEERQNFSEMLEQVPLDISDLLTSPQFEDACRGSFIDLDQDGNGILTYDELRPVLKQMISEQFHDRHVTVTDDHCKRLMMIFDTDGNGVLSFDEWMEFAKYVAASSLIEAEDQRQHPAFADQGFSDEPRGEAVLQNLRENRLQLYQDLRVLPAWLQNLFEHGEFMRLLQQEFEHIDKDRRGAVSAVKLIPTVVSLSQAHSPLRVTRHQCQELLRFFDAGSASVLSLKEFAEFTEFAFIMSCLLQNNQASPKVDHKKYSKPIQEKQALSQADSALTAAQAQISGMTNEIAWLSQQLDENASEELEMSGTGMSQAGEAPIPEEMRSILQDMRHLQLDLDFSNRKVDQLKEEKRELLQVQSRLQTQVRELQQRSEESEQKLQHQELDMRSMVTSDSISAGPSHMLSTSQILEADPSTLEGVPKGIEKMSRAQAISALQLLHHELHKERKSREKAERRSQKCLERLNRLMGTVERQRDDISIMEKRCRAMESMAGDRERRLQEGLTQADSLRTLLRNLSEEPAGGLIKATTGSFKPKRGPGGPLGGPLSRQRSAPQGLPRVTK